MNGNQSISWLPKCSTHLRSKPQPVPEHTVYQKLKQFPWKQHQNWFYRLSSKNFHPAPAQLTRLPFPLGTESVNPYIEKYSRPLTYGQSMFYILRLLLHNSPIMNRHYRLVSPHLSTLDNTKAGISTSAQVAANAWLTQYFYLGGWPTASFNVLFLFRLSKTGTLREKNYL